MKSEEKKESEEKRVERGTSFVEAIEKSEMERDRYPEPKVDASTSPISILFFIFFFIFLLLQ